MLEAGSFVIPGSPVELVVVDADHDLKIQIAGVGELAVCFRANGENASKQERP